MKLTRKDIEDFRSLLTNSKTPGIRIDGSVSDALANALCNAAVRGMDVEPVELQGEVSETRDSLAGKLIDAWVAAHGKQIPWAKAVQIVAIVTGTASEQTDRLLKMDDKDGACGMCGRSDEAEKRGYANGYATAIETAAQKAEEYPAPTVNAAIARKIRALKP